MGAWQQLKGTVSGKKVSVIQVSVFQTTHITGEKKYIYCYQDGN